MAGATGPIGFPSVTLVFPYDFDRRFAPIWWPLGAREGRDGVTVSADTFEATYGRFVLRTPISNIASAENTGSYNPLKSVGLRMSMADSGLTMGTTGASGVCVTFHEKVGRVIGPWSHRGLTVTVADPDGLVRALGFGTGS